MFLQVMRTGYVKARKLSSIMPFGEFANLTDDDLKAIFAYRHSLPDVKTHSGQQPAANLLQTVPPVAWWRRTELTRKTVKDLTTVARSSAIIRCMRHQWAISAVCAAALVGSLPAQMHGGGSRGGGSMGHGGFSSSGFRGGPSTSAAPHFGQSFGTGLRQPAFHSGLPVGTFRGPAFSNRHFRNRVFFSSVYPGYFGYYGYPGFYSGDFYSSANSYPDYEGSNYYDSTQNDVAQQQQDIDRLEDEVARLRAQRESDQRESHEASASQAESTSELPTPSPAYFPRQAYPGSAELRSGRWHTLDFRRTAGYEVAAVVAGY